MTVPPPPLLLPHDAIPGAFDHKCGVSNRLKEFNRENFILDIYLVDLNETEINISMNARFTIIIFLQLFFCYVQNISLLVSLCPSNHLGK